MDFYISVNKIQNMDKNFRNTEKIYVNGKVKFNNIQIYEKTE